MTLDFAVAELGRRLSNIIRVGVIADLDTEDARVKVEFLGTEESPGILTDWLPWITTRAGDDISWWAPTVGEQVLLLSPSGEIGAGIVLPAIYSNQKPPNGNTQSIRRVTYSDGTMIEYDKEQSKLSVNCVGSVELIAAGDVSVESGGNVSVVAAGFVDIQSSEATVTASQVTINGEVAINGNVTVSGNISSGGNISAVGALSGLSITAGGMSASGGAMSAGSVSASGDVTAGGISLASHVHGGVMAGGGTTGGPQ